MRKELGKWMLDVAKYITTAVVLTSLFDGVEQKTVIFGVGTAAAVIALVAGLLLIKDNSNNSKEV